MHVIEVLSRLWERTAPVVGVLLFIVRVLTFFLFRKPSVQPPSKWHTGRGARSSGPTRFYSASRSNYPKRWSVNDIPRP